MTAESKVKRFWVSWYGKPQGPTSGNEQNRPQNHPPDPRILGWWKTDEQLLLPGYIHSGPGGAALETVTCLPIMAALLEGRSKSDCLEAVNLEFPLEASDFASWSKVENNWTPENFPSEDWMRY